MLGHRGAQLYKGCVGVGVGAGVGVGGGNQRLPSGKRFGDRPPPRSPDTDTVPRGVYCRTGRISPLLWINMSLSIPRFRRAGRPLRGRYGFTLQLSTA